MIKRETLEPLEKEDIINIFAEFSNRVEKKATITEHQVYIAKCKSSHISTSSFPKGINAPVQYGKNLSAFVSYLSTRQYITYQRIPELLKCMSNVAISEVNVFNILNRVVNKLYPVYLSIKTDIKNAKVVGSDETGTEV